MIGIAAFRPATWWVRFWQVCAAVALAGFLVCAGGWKCSAERNSRVAVDRDAWKTAAGNYEAANKDWQAVARAERERIAREQRAGRAAAKVNALVLAAALQAQTKAQTDLDEWNGRKRSPNCTAALVELDRVCDRDLRGY